MQALIESQKTGRLAFKEVGTNTAIGFNVLSIVVEVDCRPWLRSGYGPLLAVVGETVVAGKLPIRIERIGRPEIKNVILQLKQFDQVNRDLEVRDLYNLEDAFHMSKDYGDVYRARMHANLAMHDRLDGKTDWPLGPDGVHPLTELLLADYLVVDITKPYAADSFFEIEQATLGGRAHQTCGGRSLNDDVIDKVLTLLVNGGKGPRVSDGVDRPQTPVSDVFPLPGTANSSATGQARTRPCNWPTKLARIATMTAKSTVVLELDDIQAGALEPRPVPYAGLYQILRLDDRHAGRELLRRLIPYLDSVASFDPKTPVSLAVALSFQGLKALGVPEESLATFPPEFQQGMAARSGGAWGRGRKRSRALGETAGFAGRPSRGGRARARLCPPGGRCPLRPRRLTRPARRRAHLATARTSRS